MADKNSEKSFFEQTPVLKIEKTATAVENKSGTLPELLAKFKINGSVIAHCMNELKFGYYENGQFRFADDSELDAKYLLQLRIFNEAEELLLQRNGSSFLARHIKDSADENGAQEYVDSSSPLFGTRDDNAKLPQGFVRLVESGRKISLTIPADKIADNYNLTTRSYIVYDEKTGQAGYGFWRFTSIKAK